MTRLAASFRSAYAAALCALALLAFAQVRSTTMQAAEGVATAPCAMPGMPEMAPPGPSTGKSSAPGKAHPACGYCAAAAHAPLLANVLRTPAPSAVVWTVVPPRGTAGARGPPAFRSRARDPPPPLTA